MQLCNKFFFLRWGGWECQIMIIKYYTINIKICCHKNISADVSCFVSADQTKHTIHFWHQTSTLSRKCQKKFWAWMDNSCYVLKKKFCLSQLLGGVGGQDQSCENSQLFFFRMNPCLIVLGDPISIITYSDCSNTFVCFLRNWCILFLTSCRTKSTGSF